MIINPVASIENLGGKGYQLTLLHEICCVPDFFVLCFEANGEIESIDIQEQILTDFESREMNFVSVRSSATVEDSKTASFAGMFETKLNVTKNTLIQAIKDVMCSVNETRVADYCRINGIDLTTVKMRVIIQKMVNSKVSGVCITRENKESKTLLIEACYGLGEALVSGIITPDSYRVDRYNMEITSQNIGFQKVMFDRTTNTKPIPVPFHMKNAKKLLDKEIVEVARECIKIEKSLNFLSADIEWAYEKDKLYILQARPFNGKI
jgi:pyruvate,water dikinase